MKKLSLLAAAAIVLAWAGNAQAQVTQTLTATANIDAVLELNVVDDQFDCGTVDASSTNCGNASEQAEFEVVSNSDWTLTLVDDETSTSDQVTVLGGNNSDDDFVISLQLSATSGNATGSEQILVTETGTIANLDNDDDYGSYSGTATLTLTGS